MCTCFLCEAVDDVYYYGSTGNNFYVMTNNSKILHILSDTLNLAKMGAPIMTLR